MSPALRAVDDQRLSRRRVPADIHRRACPATQVHQLLIARPHRMRIGLPRGEPQEIAAPNLLLPRGGVALALDDQRRAARTGVEDVHPLVLVGVPVHDGGLDVRIDVAEVHAELGEPAAVTEREGVPYRFGVDRVRTLGERV